MNKTRTGHGAMPVSRSWIETIYEQCGPAGVPLFMKDNLTGLWNPLQRDLP